MNQRTHIVVRQTASGGLEMLSDAQPEQMARNVARDLPGSHAAKFDEIGNTMNTTTQQTTAETTEFRRLLLANGIVDPSPYEWLDGEAWYRGEPIENRQSDGERAAIDEMRR